jgi:hypothetical protein
MKNKQVKHDQLGQDPSKASYKLVKDLMWMFITETNRNICHQCGETMCRNTFSIEHKIPWLHSDTPKELFFDLNNISFSHLKCNVKAGRRNNPTPEETRERIRLKSQKQRDKMPSDVKKIRRREQYLRTGK